MVLKARLAPTALSPDVVTDFVVASIIEVFWASMVRSAVVVVTSLFAIYALDLLNTRLVAMMPLIAMESPDP